jgi:hypothetical protein
MIFITKLNLAYFMGHLYYNITLNIPTCFDSQGIVVRESTQSNTAQKQIFACSRKF